MAWAVCRNWEWLGLWHGRKFLNARNYYLPPSPIFLSPLRARGNLMALWKAEAASNFLTFTLLLLPRLKTSLCLTVTGEVSTMRGPLSQHSTAAPRPRHNIPFIHAERCLRKMLSLCPLIKYCMLTGEKRRTFFWLASALTFQLRVYLCSHSQSVLFVTCWQYSQQRGGILNDSLK